MSWWRRSRTAVIGGRSEQRAETGRTREHLENFVRTRVGVEAFIEPATNMTPPTVLLIATTGEWTRRRLTDRDIVHDLAGRLHVPVYDVQLVGYPQRMRDWTNQVRQAEREATRRSTPPA